MRKTAILLFLLSIIATTTAQNGTRIEGLSYPWAGGLNACQFGQLDLDGDGSNDLIAFDRHGGRLLTFLNKGGHGEIQYLFAPEYTQYFPHIDDWLILADYDNDGFNDIFTYSKGWAGIKVFRNNGTTPPSFTLIKSPYLTSTQNGGEVNILATNADYPAIIDIDHDGDLDILTFWALGTFIEKHRNMSQELYGTPDSLVFVKDDSCWGFVAESEEDNTMYLDTCIFGRSVTMKNNDRHRGATFAMTDIDGNGLTDLLLGDVDYPNITLLLNNGNENSATITSQSNIFPHDNPINMFSMPLPFFGDINNDGLPDMLVSPFDPNGWSCKGENSVWLYINEGDSRTPDFRLHTKSFLQNKMIDVGTGSYPTICDINNDGLNDLLIGNIGDISHTYYHYGALKVQRTAKITIYKNVSTATENALEPINTDMARLSELELMGLFPTADDIDGDQKNEFIVGTAAGKLLLLDDDFSITDTNYLNHSVPFSAPCLFDIDHDGITDIVVGRQDGKLSLYKGSRSSNKTSFQLTSDHWGNVDVRDYNTSYYGYSTPTLFKYDGRTMLLVGSEQGKLFLFDCDSGNDTFDDISDMLDLMFDDFSNHFGMMAAPAIGDLDGDGELELIVGNFGGGLRLFNSDIKVIHTIDEHQTSLLDISPNPTHNIVRIKAPIGTKIEIIDLTGNIIKRAVTINPDLVIDTSDIGCGIYLVKASRGGITSTVKLVKTP